MGDTRLLSVALWLPAEDDRRATYRCLVDLPARDQPDTSQLLANGNRLYMLGRDALPRDAVKRIAVAVAMAQLQIELIKADLVSAARLLNPDNLVVAWAGLWLPRRQLGFHLEKGAPLDGELCVRCGRGLTVDATGRAVHVGPDGRSGFRTCHSASRAWLGREVPGWLTTPPSEPIVGSAAAPEPP